MTSLRKRKGTVRIGAARRTTRLGCHREPFGSVQEMRGRVSGEEESTTDLLTARARGEGGMRMAGKGRERASHFRAINLTLSSRPILINERVVFPGPSLALEILFRQQVVWLHACMHGPTLPTCKSGGRRLGGRTPRRVL